MLVGNDDTVTLFIHKAEMGQGTVTSLSMLLAEELECDWSKIRTEFPGVDRAYGGFQGVVGSQSIRSSYVSLRQAGASAREMLIAAAAQKWGVDKSACRAEKSTVDQHRHQRAAHLRQPGGGRGASCPCPAMFRSKIRRSSRSSASRASASIRPARWMAASLSASTCGCPICSTPWWSAARCSAAAVASFDDTKTKAISRREERGQNFERRGRDRR